MKKLLITVYAALFAFAPQAQANDIVFSYEWTELHEWIKDNTATILTDQFEGEELEQALCLATNIYHEARSSTYYDMSSTAHVVLTRKSSKKFRSTICDVVYQPSQFSWTNDGKSDRPYETEAWLVSQFVTFMVMNGYSTDQTGGADHYHMTKVNPRWSKYGVNRRVIGAHEYMTLKSP